MHQASSLVWCQMHLQTYCVNWELKQVPKSINVSYLTYLKYNVCSNYVWSRMRYFTLLNESPALALQWLCTSFNLLYCIVKKKYHFCNEKNQQEESNRFNLDFQFISSQTLNQVTNSRNPCLYVGPDTTDIANQIMLLRKWILCGSNTTLFSGTRLIWAFHILNYVMFCKTDVTSQLLTVVYLLIVYAKLLKQWDKGNLSGYTQLCSRLIHQTTLIEMVILPRRKTLVLLHYIVFKLVCLYLWWSNTS